jgi:serine protease
MRKDWMSAAVALALLAPLAIAVASPADAQSQTRASNSAAVARVILKLKVDAKLLPEGVRSGSAATARADVLAKRLGVPLRAGAEIAERTQVIVGTGITSDELAAQLARDADVEYAVPDRMRRPLDVPNDPLYAAGVPGNGPAAGQWYLRAPAGEAVSSIDAERAWSVSQGSQSIVVAVLDTGVRFDHPDLLRAAEGGNLLPGADFIADPEVANDGDGRDDDASDPGDWLTEAEVSNGARFAECSEGMANDSSWHGTAVSGVIAALTGNGVGMASVGRNVRVLPVRVLGKCGGFDSDILAGMRWAAGLFVPGAPVNASPAHVLNMSLGSEGACNAAYRNVVAEVLASGATIVASAGNEAGHPVFNPANCNGVIAVAALRHVGTKVGFSNLGPEIAIAAPGGNCVNIDPGTPCLYPILTSSNGGITTPGENVFSDSFNITVGTSFSAPLVAGTVALMLSVRASLSFAQVKAILQGTSRPFPATSIDPSVPRCTAPQLDTAGMPVDQLECLCTVATCGTGMLDAGAAVVATQRGVQVSTVVEYHNAALDHYFVTWLPEEIAALDAGVPFPGWKRTGQSFRTFTTPDAGTSPVCRYYIPPARGDSHFYGRGAAECEATGLAQPSLVLEASRFMHMMLPNAGTCPANATPVYRVFNNRADANHRYLTDRSLRSQMIARGWIAEGDGPDFVVMCAPR